MLYRICSVVRRDETSPKGDGSIRRYFCGEAAAAEKQEAAAAAADDGEAAAEVGADNGAHRRRFGDAGLSSGSKSRVLFRVAPHAMPPERRARVGLRGGPGRGARGEGRAGAPRASDPTGWRAERRVGKRRREGRPPPPRQGQGPGPARRGREGRCRQLTPAASGGLFRLLRRGSPPGEAPGAPAVRSSSAPLLRRSCAETGSLRQAIPAP